MDKVNNQIYQLHYNKIQLAINSLASKKHDLTNQYLKFYCNPTFSKDSQSFIPQKQLGIQQSCHLTGP